MVIELDVGKVLSVIAIILALLVIWTALKNQAEITQVGFKDLIFKELKKLIVIMIAIAIAL